MALIKCPNCQKNISDKALNCPACGFKINTETLMTCAECGGLIFPDELVCSNCGYPIENHLDTEETINMTPKLNTGKIIVSILLAISIIIFAFAIKSHIVKQKLLQYEDNLKQVTYLIMTGAANAEEAGNLIHDVWYNTIFEEYDLKTDKYTNRSSGYGFNDDFNDSLENLFADDDFKKKIDSINENQYDVNELMKLLSNPPQEYEEAYINLKKLYESYLNFTSIVVSPSGNLQSFTSDFNDADSDVISAYKLLEMYVQ